MMNKGPYEIPRGALHNSVFHEPIWCRSGLGIAVLFSSSAR